MCCVNALSRFCFAQVWKGGNDLNTAFTSTCGFQGTNFAWQEVHCKGTQQRGQLIDDVFFPWSSKVNPIQVRRVGNLFSDITKEDHPLGFTIYRTWSVFQTYSHLMSWVKHDQVVKTQVGDLAKVRADASQRQGRDLPGGCFQRCLYLDFRKMEMTISLYLLYMNIFIWWFQRINKLLNSTWLRILCFVWDWDLRVGTGDGTRDRVSQSFYLLNCNKAKAASFDPTAAWGTTGEAEEQVPVHNIK